MGRENEVRDYYYHFHPFGKVYLRVGNGHK